MNILPASSLKGELYVPGDKSISHRSVMLGAIAKGDTEIFHYLQGEDCLATISCFQSMGIEIENKVDRVIVHGKGLYGLSKPRTVLDCKNSGTTLRLLSGILAAQPFESVLTGDDSIKKRPMKRIIEPLSQMNAQIESEQKNGCAPIHIYGKSLCGIHYHSPISSAQVKSAILLAGLYAKQKTLILEPFPSRDHSERMLASFGADIHCEGQTVAIKPASQLFANQIRVPGDISSAAYFLAAGLLVPNSEILIKDVGINKTRSGILQVIQAMGGQITCYEKTTSSGEPTASIMVSSSPLHATLIEGALIPTLIDELPIIAVMACFAHGTTIIKDASELKVKESNRIAVMVENLKKMGADIQETSDGMIIHGTSHLQGATVDSHHDHRVAMSLSIAALMARGETTILHASCVSISYPNFYQTLIKLKQK